MGIYQTVLAINHQMLQQSEKGYLESDLRVHLMLLDEIANLHLLQVESLDAARLFEKEAYQLNTAFPRVGLHCVERAINFYSYCENTQCKRAELFIYKAKLLMTHSFQPTPWRWVIDALMQAKILDPACDIDELYEECGRQYVEFSQGIDGDLLFTLEEAVLTYHNLENTSLFDESATLTTKNKVTELIISLRNILDQAYARLITKLIAKPEKRKLGALYFPLRSSKSNLLLLWKEMKLLFESSLPYSHFLDRDYEQSYLAIIDAEPFTYYSEASSNGLWKRSWLEILTAINNDSKHVRLTPVNQKLKLAEEKGTLIQAKREIQIQYMEKRFYAWSFVGLLDKFRFSVHEKTRVYFKSLLDADLIKLSYQIRKLLKATNHIIKHHSSHPFALEYQNAKRKNKLQSKLSIIREKYLNTIKKSLSILESRMESIIFSQLCESVCDFMLRRASQQVAFVELEGDLFLDAQLFLRTVLQNVHKLVTTFAKQIQEYYLTQPLKTFSICKRDLQYLSETEALEHSGVLLLKTNKLLQKKQSLECQPAHKFLWIHLKQYHKLVKQLALAYIRQSNFRQAAQVYINSNQFCATAFPILAIQYLEEGLSLQRQSLQLEEADHTLIELLDAYKKYDLIQRSKQYITAIVESRNNYFHKIRDKQNELEDEELWKKGDIDADIFLQIQHAKESFFILHF